MPSTTPRSSCGSTGRFEIVCFAGSSSPSMGSTLSLSSASAWATVPYALMNVRFGDVSAVKPAPRSHSSSWRVTGDGWPKRAPNSWGVNQRRYSGARGFCCAARSGFISSTWVNLRPMPR